MTSTPVSSQKGGRREWIGLAVLAFPCVLLSMDFTVLHLAVPALTAHLKPSSAQLLWIVDIYGFMISGALITIGTLGDRIGRRRLLMIGAVIFGSASVFAAFSTTAAMLIVARGLLGVAGATLMPSTLALIRNMFHDDDQRRIAIAIWINAYIIGGAIGPLAGGILLEHFWWGSVFLLNVPVMALLILLGPRLLPEFRDPNAGSLDLISAGLSLAAMLSVIYGIKQFAQNGDAVIALTTIVIGVALAAVFVARQRRLTHPIIDLELFALPAFSASICTQLVAAMSTSGIYLFVVQYLQLVRGFSPLVAGIWLLPSTVAGIVGTLVAPFLARRTHPSTVIGGGMLVSAVGMLLLTQIDRGPGVAVFLLAYCIMSLTISLAMTLTTDLLIAAAPAERAGSASAISETSGELGLALGIAVLGSVGTAFYRHAISAALPAGIANGAAERARSTLSGAIATAGQLGSAVGPELADAARAAFAQSLELVAGISAIIVIVTSIATLILLRRPIDSIRPDTLKSPEHRSAIF